MKTTQISGDEFLLNTQSCESPRSTPRTTTDISKSRVVVANFDDEPAHPKRRPGFKNIKDLVAKYESDPEKAAALRGGRKWVSETLYEDRKTISSLRLSLGMSQAQLAEAMGTSQSHIARIEKSRDNYTLVTLRKLCSVLRVDMNTLDQALREQESILAERKQQG